MRLKKTLNISTIFNYQLSTVCYRSLHGSSPSKTLGSESEIMWGMAKFGKHAKESEGAVRHWLSSSAPSGLFLSLSFSCPLCRRSPPSRSLEQTSKTLKNKQARPVLCVHVSWVHYFLGYEIFTMTCSFDVNFANQLLLPAAGCYFEPCINLNWPS